MLGAKASANALNHRFWSLRATDNWPSISIGLTLLSDYLYRHGAPIDYARRRRLDYSPLLTPQDCRAVAQAVGIPLDDKAAADVRIWLIERISGNAAVPAGVARLRCGPNDVSAFPPPQLAEALIELASRFLRRSGEQ